VISLDSKRQLKGNCQQGMRGSLSDMFLIVILAMWR